MWGKLWTLVINKNILNVIHWAGFNEDVYIHGYTGDRFVGAKGG
jgi:hypothetical protein